MPGNSLVGVVGVSPCCGSTGRQTLRAGRAIGHVFLTDAVTCAGQTRPLLGGV